MEVIMSNKKNKNVCADNSQDLGKKLDISQSQNNNEHQNKVTHINIELDEYNSIDNSDDCFDEYNWWSA